MPRRSSRLESKPAIAFSEQDADTPGGNDNDFTEDHLSDAEHKEPTSKKRKTKSSSASTSKNTKGKRGKLRQLPEMPIDILYEVFGHLRPYDLLRLARTTKALRNILLRRSAKSVWKDALANIEGLPDCPADLNEPQFASLAFDPFCHFCFGPNVHNVLWTFRVRACQKCLESENFLDAHQLYSRLMTQPQFEIQDFNTTVSLFPCASIKIKWTRGFYRTTDFEEISDRIIQVKKEGESAVQEFVRERRDANNALKSHSDLCVGWQRDSGDERLNELKALKERRKTAIWQRLRDEGWGDDLDKNGIYDLQPLTRHALVKKPQELTDRIWSNIKPTLIPILAGLKEKRLDRERFQALKDRYMTVADLLKAYALQRPIMDIIPGTADVCEMHPFKTVIWDTPMDVAVTEVAFESAMEQLPQLITQWRDEKDTELLHILDPSFELAKDRGQLDLVTSQFDCQACRHVIAYPRILIHKCMTAYTYSYRGRADLDETLERIWRNFQFQTWHYTKDRVREARTKVRHVLSCFLKDPDSTTGDEMDEMDARVECPHCSSVSYGRLVMDWRTAVDHMICCPSSYGKSTPALKLLDDFDTAKVKAMEKPKEHDSLLNPLVPRQLCCTRCRACVHNTLMSAHMQQSHDVDNMTAEDYCLPPDGSSLKPTIRLPPPDKVL